MTINKLSSWCMLLLG